MAAVHERIASRSLIPGSRLPSIRAFASSLSVSKSTVVKAYERLRADDIIQSRPGAGYYVCAPLAPLSLSKTEPCLDRNIDPLWKSRESLDAKSDVFKPGCGWLPPEWMPEASLRRAWRKMARSPATTLVDYATAKGLLPLRELLSRRLNIAGITADPADILLTESGTPAIDLLCRCLLKSGDTKIATSFSGGSLAAETTLAILTDSSYRKYLERLRQNLAEQRALVAKRLACMDIVPWTIPRAGLYLWCRLPDGMNSTDVARRALTHQVVLAPGNAFSLSRNFSDYLRFNVAQTHHASVYSALELSMNQTRQDQLG